MFRAVNYENETAEAGGVGVTVVVRGLAVKLKYHRLKPVVSA